MMHAFAIIVTLALSACGDVDSIEWADTTPTPSPTVTIAVLETPLPEFRERSEEEPEPPNLHPPYAPKNGCGRSHVFQPVPIPSASPNGSRFPLPLPSPGGEHPSEGVPRDTDADPVADRAEPDCSPVPFEQPEKPEDS